jgi:hypothetical protein
VILEAARFQVELEEGEEKYLSEWISRKIGYKRLPITTFSITKGLSEDRLTIRHRDEPIPLEGKRAESTE